MDVNVRIPGVVQREFGFEDREIVVTLDQEAATVRSVLDAVGDRYEGSRRYFHADGDRHDDIQVMVNGRTAEDYSTTVRDGDQVQVALPIAGG